MRNFRLVLSYDGTDFHGWQIQPNAVTVQGCLMEALEGILEETVQLHGSGRTDAGAHALAQVANFKSASKIPIDSLPKALNRRLPPSLRVRRAEGRPPPISMPAIGSSPRPTSTGSGVAKYALHLFGDMFITTLSLWTSMPFPGQQRSLKASMTSLLSQSPRAGKRGGARRSGLRRVESSGPNFAAEELPPCWSMRSVATDSSATW